MLGKRLRKSKGVNQYELAERLGFSRGKLANYEQGGRQPDYETLQQIADYFEVTTDYLLGRTDKKTSYSLYRQADQKDEEDIARRLDEIKNDIERADRLTFDVTDREREAETEFSRVCS